MSKLFTETDLFEKNVLLRVDFNVPIKDGKVLSETRIDEVLPTIQYLLNNKCKVVVCSHLGRPDGQKNEKYSLKPVYEILKSKFSNVKIHFGDLKEQATKETFNKMNVGEILLLENLRFYAEEENNDKDFCSLLASYGDMYINDAFGTAHRKHASTYGVASLLPSYYGFLINRELMAFDKILNQPKRPLVALLGGAKVKDKIDVITNLLDKVDVLLIGGGMCFTFLKALRADVGKSLVDKEKLDLCYDIIKKAIEKKVKIVLPVDFVCAESLESNEAKVFKAGKMPQNYMGLDIGPKTVKLFCKFIKKAKSLIWNGPMGVYENPLFKNGTKQVALQVAKNKHCYSVAGGGDVVASIEEFGLDEYFSHISTGGGASLKLMEGKKLAVISAIEDKQDEKMDCCEF